MDKPLNVQELAELLGVSRDWVYTGVEAGSLPHHRFGRHIRFTADDIRQIFADAARQPTVAPIPITAARRRKSRRAA